ncbi:LpqN/LpqT family lipoprotein [Nocardia macrotermitis]|uniref:Uncharacterized protein n=1 Tax=Nocardia macrotermitis TaxID=2585198 RepID=A0A7K0CXV3_9NOCA|nr:LpqN/LpqT family lipoprotein [Nocardia macrotermitis]MQY18335.1 hypothetical protein [Nocardia macrotermitis]
MNAASQHNAASQDLDDQTLPTIGEFLAAVGATPVVVYPEYPGVPVVLLDIPGDWHGVVREVLPNAFGAWALPAEAGSVAAESGWVENAVLMVWRLSLPVDPRAVMRCAFTDSRRLPDWVELGGDVEDYDGFPSAEISGMYTYADLSLWMSTRYLIASTPTGQYLLQLTVTTFAAGADEGTFIAESFSVQVPPARPGVGAHDLRTGPQPVVVPEDAGFRSGMYQPESESRWRQADYGDSVESFEPEGVARRGDGVIGGYESVPEQVVPRSNRPVTGAHAVVRDQGFDTPAHGYESTDPDAYSTIMGVEPAAAESDPRGSHRREPGAPSTGNMDFRI